MSVHITLAQLLHPAFGMQGIWTSLSSWMTPGRAIALGVLVVVLMMLAVPLVAARMLSIDEHDLVVEGLPDELDGLKVVFVADVHAGPYFGKGRMRRLVEKVNGCEPDIVILGGDYVGGKARGAGIFYPAIKDIRASRAKLAVLGNHDVWEGADEARKGLREAGFEVLENSNSRIDVDGATLVVAGLDDLYTGCPDVTAAAECIEPEDTAILVSHNPDAFAKALPEVPDVWNLALAGHTHGGQVSLAGKAMVVPSEFGSRYRSGWMEEEGVPILVSNGVGTVTLPIRLQTPAEFHVIALRKAE